MPESNEEKVTRILSKVGIEEDSQLLKLSLLNEFLNEEISNLKSNILKLEHKINIFKKICILSLIGLIWFVGFYAIFHYSGIELHQAVFLNFTFSHLNLLFYILGFLGIIRELCFIFELQILGNLTNGITDKLLNMFKNNDKK